MSFSEAERLARLCLPTVCSIPIINLMLKTPFHKLSIGIALSNRDFGNAFQLLRLPTSRAQLVASAHIACVESGSVAAVALASISEYEPAAMQLLLQDCLYCNGSLAERYCRSISNAKDSF